MLCQSLIGVASPPKPANTAAIGSDRLILNGRGTESDGTNFYKKNKSKAIEITAGRRAFELPSTALNQTAHRA